MQLARDRTCVAGPSDETSRGPAEACATHPRPRLAEGMRRNRGTGYILADVIGTGGRVVLSQPIRQQVIGPAGDSRHWPPLYRMTVKRNGTPPPCGLSPGDVHRMTTWLSSCPSAVAHTWRTVSE